MSVRIIVDSASDLTKERADALNLDYMPLKTIFGETEYLDGVTISHKEFYEKLIECGTIPTTSQVSPHDFEAKFKEVKEAGDTAVVVCPLFYPVHTRVHTLRLMAMRTVSH